MAGKTMTAVVSISGVLDKSMTKAVESAQKAISGLDPKLLKVSAAAGTVAAAAAPIGAKMIEVGTDFQKATNQIQAATGASEKEMQQLGDTVKDIYSQGMGESMQDVADSLSVIKQISGASGKSLESLTEGAMVLRDTLGYDVSESARAAKAMMDNFGIGGEEALSMIAAGAQNGLDFSGELLDSISEYSVQFSKMGLSADEMFHIFQSGTENGAWNLDKIGDAVKESAIRVIDLSDTSKSAFESIGLDAETMEKAFGKGGDSANNALQQVLTGIAAMDDPLKQNEVGVQLFGTMWEDLGKDVVTAFGDIGKGAYDTKNALEGMKEVKYNDLGSAVEAIGRQLSVALLPAATEIANKLNEMMPEIKEAIQFVTDNAGTIIPILGGVAAAIGGLKFAGVVKEVGGYVNSLKNLFSWKKKTEAATGALNSIYMKETAASKKSAVATKLQQTATKLFSREQMKSRMESLKNIAATVRESSTKKESAAATKAQSVATKLFSKEAMKARLETLKSTVATVKNTVTQKASSAAMRISAAATRVWSAAQKAASLAARGLGAAMRFMTGPIGLIITGITAAIAIGITLYKNWDTVKAKAVALGAKIKGVFVGIKNKIVGAFTVVRDRVGAILGGLASIVKKPINAVISIVNKMIDSVNTLSFDIPDWVPGIGGDTIGFDIPKLPLLAAGGFTQGPSIAGEAGKEAVISFDPAYRTQNIDYWKQAGRMLGADTDISLPEQKTVNLNMGGVVFSPQIEIKGNASKTDVLAALEQEREAFMDKLEEWWEEKEAFVFG